LHDVTGVLGWLCYNPYMPAPWHAGQSLRRCEVALPYTMRPDRLAHRVNLEEQESCLIPFGALGLSVEKTQIREHCRRRSEVVLGSELNAKRLELLQAKKRRRRRYRQC